MAKRQPIISLPTRRVASERGREILALLAEAYPDAQSALVFRNAFELLIAVILSAQTTDAMVNQVTPALFDYYPSPMELAVADTEHVDQLIHRIGLHRSKAKHIVVTSQMLVERHHGQVPRQREALEALAGVGRKTASVVLSVAYGEAAFAVDTHVFRVSQRLGLALGRTPLDIEQQVTRLLPQEQWRHAHHWLILHGREVCKAQAPRCGNCSVAKLCPSQPIIEQWRSQILTQKAGG